MERLKIEPLPPEQPETIRKILERNKKLQLVKEKYKRPKIKVAFGDKLFYHLNNVGEWLIDIGARFAGKTLQQVIPDWFWVALVMVLIVGVIVLIISVS